MEEQSSSGTSEDQGTRAGLIATTLAAVDKPFNVSLMDDKTLRQNCELIAADEDALLLKHQSGTLLIPLHAIKQIRLDWDQQYVDAVRRANRPRRMVVR